MISLLSLQALYPQFGSNRERGYVTALLKDSNLAVVTENRAISTKCPSIRKPVALCLAWMNKIPVESRLRIFSSIFKEWVGRVVNGDKRSIGDWFSLTGIQISVAESENGKEVTAQSIANRLDILKFYTTVEALKALPEIVPKLRTKIDFEALQFDSSDVLRTICRDGAVSYRTLVQFGRNFLDMKDAADNEIISVEDLKRYVFHAIIHPSSFDRSQSEAEATWEDWRAATPLVREIKRGVVESLRNEVRSEVKARWEAAMATLHPDGATHPLSLAEVHAARAARGLQPATAEEMGYRADVGFCGNACMCTACPYYLEIHVGKAALHYNEADPGVLTAFSLAVSACVRAGEKDAYTILQAVKSGKHMQYEDKTRLEKVDKELCRPGRWAREIEAVKRLIPVYEKLPK